MIQNRKKFLNKLKRKEVLGMGTGRIVYEFDEDNVVKVAYTRSGIRQNAQEFTLNRTYGSEHLAKVHYWNGSDILIMEKVTPANNDIGNYHEVVDWRFDELYGSGSYSKMMKTCHFLEGIIGETTDLDQVGFSSDPNPRWIAYDYGMISSDMLNLTVYNYNENDAPKLLGLAIKKKYLD